jgi:CHAT domain-containing protein
VDKLNIGRPEGDVSARALGVTAEWPGFPALSGVAEEISGVVRGAGRGEGTHEEPRYAEGVLEGEWLLDEDFTREALSRSLASNAQAVHVASRFLLDPSSLENTVLLLGDGGTLSLRDIRMGEDLNFNGLDLLTLSACYTASGAKRGQGGEVEGFGEIVLRAGALAVLASLWPVNDLSTAELMREFYRQRYVDGKNKAEALRGAQLAVMCDGAASPVPVRGTAMAASGVDGLVTGIPPWEGTGFSHPYHMGAVRDHGELAIGRPGHARSSGRL